MADIKVVAGTCGKGRGIYEAGIFTMPDGQERPVERLLSVEAHGDVAGARNWGGQMLDGIKGSLALASNIDLTGTVSLAVAALAPLSADEPRTQVLLELMFDDQAMCIALADPRLSALITNDREVLRKGRLRFAEQEARAPTVEEGSLLSNSAGAVQAAAGAATASLGAALGFVRRRVGVEQG